MTGDQTNIREQPNIQQQQQQKQIGNLDELQVRYTYKANALTSDYQPASRYLDVELSLKSKRLATKL